MRLWTISPKYLDTKGIVALWREALLAKAVLEGKTKGYTNHPQLNRFKSHTNGIAAINNYLNLVHQEALSRKYNFDQSKFSTFAELEKIKVSKGQIEYEFMHLKNKLQQRDPDRFELVGKLKTIDIMDIFEPYDGPVEPWEVITGPKL